MQKWVQIFQAKMHELADGFQETHFPGEHTQIRVKYHANKGSDPRGRRKL
jgi:hypothetical protein